MCWHFQDVFEELHSESSFIFFLPRVITAFFINCQMFNSCVLLFHSVFSLKNRMCLNRTVFTQKALVWYIWSVLVQSISTWTDSNRLSFQRLSDKHYSTICARTDWCLSVSMLWHISIVTYLLETICSLVNITIYVILHLKKKNSQSIKWA